MLEINRCKNVAELLLARLQASPKAKAVSFLPRSQSGGESNSAAPWKTLTWQEFGDKVRYAAAGLLALGFKKGHRLALYAPTQLSWVVLDTATLCIGGVTVPIHEKVLVGDTIEILRRTKAAFLFVDGQAQWESIIDKIGTMPDLMRVITAEAVMGDADTQISMAELEERGMQGLQRAGMLGPQAREGDLLAHASRSVEKDRDACIYHSSGTTGAMRPVPLTHENLLAQIRQAHAIFKDVFTGEEAALSMLPYAHIFGRFEFLCHLAFGAHGYLAEGFDRLGELLPKASPTIIFTVPRVLEKIYHRTMLKVEGLSGMQRYVAESSLALKAPGGLKGFFADKLFYSKIRDALGGRLRTVVSAGAPLAPDVGRFFQALGVKVLEGYGLTETTGAIACTQGQDDDLGTVGRVFPECEVKIASDGEILARGPNIFKAYGYSSTEKHTDQPSPFIEDWFQTGDLGLFDDRGRLVVTGRKKDLIITSAGKNIAPQKLEALFAASPFIDQVVVVGNNRPFVVALVVPNRDALSQREEFKDFMGAADWHYRSEVKAVIQAEIDAANDRLASFESIKKFVILPQPLQFEKGEITLTQKLRRDAIAAQYTHLIDPIYDEWERSGI